jgi:hypothetical protein
MISKTECELAKSFREPELIDAIKDIMSCHYTMGLSLTRQQANRIEKITFLFPDAIPVSEAGKERLHFTKRELWRFVWGFIQAYPLLGASTVDKILEKLEFVQTLPQD